MYDTSDIDTIVKCRFAIGYQQIYETCKRTCGKETKAYPTIRIPTHSTELYLTKINSSGNR